jgi:hypothetical protein
MVLGMANENVGISFHISHSGYEVKEDSKSGEMQTTRMK